MKQALYIAGLALVIAASSVLAHSGVKDPTVKARMNAMSAIGENTKILGTMAKGQVAFDAAVAQMAARVIADHAGQISVLFKEPADDPKSESLPAIWQSYSDFLIKAEALESAANAAANGIHTKADLTPALAAIGGTCKACHQTYRLKK